jgi:hypothetical protein
MKPNYYKGHNELWMDNFRNAVKDQSGLTKSKAICLAIVIKKLMDINKSRKSFRLSYAALEEYGLRGKRINRYLVLFQEKGLLKVKLGSPGREKGPEISEILPSRDERKSRQ